MAIARFTVLSDRDHTCTSGADHRSTRQPHSGSACPARDRQQSASNGRSPAQVILSKVAPRRSDTASPAQPVPAKNLLCEWRRRHELGANQERTFGLPAQRHRRATGGEGARQSRLGDGSDGGERYPDLPEFTVGPARPILSGHSQLRLANHTAILRPMTCVTAIATAALAIVENTPFSHG